MVGVSETRGSRGEVSELGQARRIPREIRREETRAYLQPGSLTRLAGDMPMPGSSHIYANTCRPRAWRSLAGSDGGTSLNLSDGIV